MAELVVRERRYYPGNLAVRLVNVLVGLIELVFALRLLLELLGASAASQFVATVYSISDRLLGPFAGAFQNFSLGGGYVVDVNAIVAMIGYAILGWIVIRILSFILSSTEVW